jgi:hypothetical protein
MTATTTTTREIADAGVTVTSTDALEDILATYRADGYGADTLVQVYDSPYGAEYHYLNLDGERVPRAQITREAVVILRPLHGKYRVVTDDSGVTEYLSSSDDTEALADAEKWLRDGGWEMSAGTDFVTVRVEVADPDAESGWSMIAHTRRHRPARTSP